MNSVTLQARLASTRVRIALGAIASYGSAAVTEQSCPLHTLHEGLSATETAHFPMIHLALIKLDQ